MMLGADGERGERGKKMGVSINVLLCSGTCASDVDKLQIGLFRVPRPAAGVVWGTRNAEHDRGTLDNSAS